MLQSDFEDAIFIQDSLNAEILGQFFQPYESFRKIWKYPLTCVHVLFCVLLGFSTQALFLSLLTHTKSGPLFPLLDSTYLYDTAN